MDSPGGDAVNAVADEPGGSSNGPGVSNQVSRSGSLRSALGLQKTNLANQQAKAEDLLKQSTPTQDQELERYLDRLQVAQLSLRKATERVQGTHDDWVIMVQENPEVEQPHYDKAVPDLFQLLFASDEILSAIEVRLSRDFPQVDTPMQSPAHRSSGQPPPQVFGQPANNVSRTNTFKIPKINLPTFSGDYLEFKQFWGIFKANIHDRKDFSGIEKFTYLESQLEGEAKRSISGIMISDKNYEKAVDQLKARFDRADDRIVTMLYAKFTSLGQSGKKNKEKQRMLDDCEQIFQQLETAGEDLNSNKARVFGVLSKFPSKLVKDLQRFYGVGPKSSLQEVRSGLAKAIADEETTEGILGDLKLNRASQEPCQKKREDSDGTENWQYTSAMGAVSNGTRRTIKFKPGAQMLTPPTACYFCHGDHFNGECHVYPTAEKRRRRLMDLHRCLRCMQPAHQGFCPIDIKCVHCGSIAQHPSALCHIRFPMAPEGMPTSSSPAFTPKPSALKTTFQRRDVTNVNGTTAVANDHSAQFDGNASVSDSDVSDDLSPGNQHGDLTALNDSGHKSTLFQTAKVFAINPKTGQKCKLRLAMDTLSSRTYICEPVARQLGLIGDQTEKLYVSVFGTSKTLQVPSRRVEFDVFMRDGSKASIEANTIQMICRSGTTLNQWTDSERRALEHIFRASLADDPYDNDGTIDVLVGAGLVWEFVEGSRFPTAVPSLFLIPSKFGLMLCGEVNQDTEEDGTAMVCITDSSCVYPSELGLVSCDTLFEGRYPDADEYWNLERIGISDDPLESDDDKALDIFQKSVRYENGRYWVRLLWIEEKRIRLCTNYNMAYSRLRGLKKRLVLNPDLLQGYRDILALQLERDIIEKVGLQPEDPDVTRFLWFKDDSNLSLMENIAVYRFKRVNFGVVCSPFLLAATLDHHLTRENSALASTLRDDIYVDNVISGLKRSQDPMKYYHELKYIFNRAGMNIQEFCSNSPDLMAKIPEKDRMVNREAANILGLKWDSVKDDTLRLTPSVKLKVASPTPTKREVLQTIASVFDPLGFYQPALLPGKLFLQKLWELQLEWDDLLDGPQIVEWQELKRCLLALIDHRIPRFVGKLSPGCTLAVFSDASAKAYSAVVYLRVPNGDNTWNSSKIFSKSRLAPSVRKQNRTKERVTLPRLELLGATIAVRAAKFCREDLRIAGVHIDFFIDSQCVLHWIKSKGTLKRFVANRVEEIRKTTSCSFHYVPTGENPADYGTRGKLPDELMSDKMWWHGPQFLAGPSQNWSRSEVPLISNSMLEQIQAEVRPAFFGYTMIANEMVPLRFDFLGIDPSRVSCLTKLLRRTIVWLKFIKWLVFDKLSDAKKSSKTGLRDLFERFPHGKDITADDYCNAKMLWVKCVQFNHFRDILDALITPVEPKPPQIVGQLGVCLDENGLWCCRGRMGNAELSDPAKFPLLLPKNDPFTTLLVEHVHSEAMHSGVTHTLVLLRLEFWILHGRGVVRNILGKCVVCRRFKTGKPFKLPSMPALPKERVQQSYPFEKTGLDYFGPITVKVGGMKQKMWVCLFTCLSVRAVHLEAVMDFSSQEFLHCLIRFVSRRGAPNAIISDNAAQFQLVKILGDKAWKKAPRDFNVTSYASSQGIQWKFITEMAPWQGGFYERLVGLVKSTLRTSIRNRLLSWTDFVTMLAEAEAVVNSRPLTYVDADINSRFWVLRPCDFLSPLPASLSVSPDGDEVSGCDFGEAGKRLVSIWKQRCRALERLWRNWHDNYLACLRERRIVSHKSARGAIELSPLLGQVVLVVEQETPRGHWKMARVTKLEPGSDNCVRSAEVKLANGATIRRPLNLLVPLELGPQKDRETTKLLPVAESDQFEQFLASQDDEFFGFSPADAQRALDAYERANNFLEPQRQL